MITFKNLYSKVDDYGIAYNSIVLYEKKAYLYKSKCYEDGKCETISCAWKMALMIDLWLFILEFRWEKKLPE